MSTEYKLSYTASDIDEKLGMISQLSDAIGVLANLETTEKSNLVGAINEVAKAQISVLELDNTLSQSGKAADAKAVGDAIDNLNDLIGDVAVSEQISQAISEIPASSWEDIMDKPFYDERIEVLMIGFAMGWDAGAPTRVDFHNELQLVAGSTYKVDFESTISGSTVKETHEVVAGSDSTLTTTCQGYQVLIQRDFFILNGCDSDGYLEVDIYEISGSVKAIDEKYIPDTIARKGDIPDVPVTSVNGMTGDVVIETSGTVSDEQIAQAVSAYLAEHGIIGLPNGGTVGQVLTIGADGNPMWADINASDATDISEVSF